MAQLITAEGALSARHQVRGPSEQLLHSGNAGLLVERTAQIRPGQGTAARELSRRLVERVNEEQEGRATILVFEETFGTKDRLHWLLHLRSFADYGALGAHGGAYGNGVFGAGVTPDEADRLSELFVEGSVRETAMLPHRWGIFGTATEAMAADESVSPVVEGADGLPWFEIQGAEAQTAMPADCTLNTATAGAVMRRTIDFNYEFRAEARVFSRTVAETVNLNMEGRATAFLFEEIYGQMDRVHFLIHMESLDVMYQLMGLDARTDPDAPRASYIQDWISFEKGGGSWDRIVVQGSTKDMILTPQVWG